MNCAGTRGRARYLLPLLVLTLLAGACGVKRTVTVPTTPRMAQARTATFDELVDGLEKYGERITSLVSTDMRVTFTSGRVETGKLQEYRSAPGYILLKRPDLIRLNVQNPLTKTSIVELVSVGDQFAVWYPRENKFYTGRNSAKELQVEGAPTFSARPSHIFEAILPQNLVLKAPENRVSLEEDRDSETKYYVLTFYREAGGPRLNPVRRLWIDRADLAVRRQFVYGDNGAVVSMIQYSDLTDVNGLLLPLAIRIERPVDGYILEMHFRTWRVNSDVPASSFVLTPPEGAQKVALTQKGKG